jgi:hypothetical protein
MTKMIKFIKTISKSVRKTPIINTCKPMTNYFTTIPTLKHKKYVIPILTQEKRTYDDYYIFDYKLKQMMKAYQQSPDHNWSNDPTKYKPFNPTFINDIYEKLNAGVKLSDDQEKAVNNVYYAFYQKGLFK